MGTMKGLLELMRNYLDLDVMEKSKVEDIATHCDRAKSGSWLLHPTQLGHPDCRLLVRKRTGAPRHTALPCVLYGLNWHGAEMQY